MLNCACERYRLSGNLLTLHHVKKKTRLDMTKTKQFETFIKLSTSTNTRVSQCSKLEHR